VLLTACGDDSETASDVEFGRYVRLAEPSFDSTGGGQRRQVVHCAQLLTLNEDGTYMSVFTDTPNPARSSSKTLGW
jgi:hypothetical protein